MKNIKVNYSFLSKIDSSWSLFLDRDGVINRKLPGDYVKSIEEFEFLDGVEKAFDIFSETFRYIFVVTNQQGIGKKIMSEEDLSKVHDYMQTKLQHRITKIYHAPQLATENSLMRKPEIGMALKAQKDFPLVDLQKSIMVGDSPSDIIFGKNAGMKTIFISEDENIQSFSDMIFSSLAEFANFLKISAKQSL